MAVFTFGTDPEFALAHAKDNRIVSAIPVLKRSKHRPIDLGDGAATYYDNVLTECRVKPGNSKEEIVANLKKLFGSMDTFLNHKFKLMAVASHNFTEKEVSHKMAREFGCTPEFDCYTSMQAMPPDAVGAATFRTAGGHIHIGMNEGFLRNLQEKIQAIQMMDIFVGVSLLLIDNDPTSPERKRLYGNAGRYRYTDYGVEYRTPGNCWLARPELVEMVHELTDLTMNYCVEGRVEQIVDTYQFGEIAYHINNNNKGEALNLLKRVEIPNDLMEKIIEFSNQPACSDVFENWL